MVSENPTSTPRRLESERLHDAASEVFPGGVSHNTRYREPHPVYIDASEGSRMVDVDGNEYVDFWNDHGASLLGHAHPDVVEAVEGQIQDGFQYGTPTEAAVRLGERIQGYVPSAERVRFCCSGTEATMYAVRLARAFTDRTHVLKVEGGWHGGNTDLAVGVYTPFDAPTTAGLPPGVEDHVHTFPMNDKEAFGDVLDEYRDDVAAVVVDPRKGLTPPREEFLDALEDAREDAGFCLIFDEVVTGFRLSPGSYQARTDVVPDLTALGKIVGGGMPVGALAGRSELFENARPDVDVSPDDRVLAGGGTFSMNPTTMVAGLTTLDVIEDEPVYERTESVGERIRTGIDAAFEAEGVDGMAIGLSSLFKPVFTTETELRSPTDVATKTDTGALKSFHRRMLDRGYFFNSGSMGNVSYAHTDEEVDAFLDATRDTLREMRADGLV